MRASAIWLCLGILWSIDAFFAWRRHDGRQALVAAIVAIGFVAAGIYFAARGKSRGR
jgi:hypothetical protein